MDRFQQSVSKYEFDALKRAFEEDRRQRQCLEREVVALRQEVQSLQRKLEDSNRNNGSRYSTTVGSLGGRSGSSFVCSGGAMQAY